MNLHLKFLKFEIAALVALALATAACNKGSSDSGVGPTAPPKPVAPQNPGPTPTLPDFALVEKLAGDATTDDKDSSLSFNVPAAGLTETETANHLAGDVQFGRSFVEENGLGPAFNASSCTSCHASDGRGALPILPIGQKKVLLGELNPSLLLRISVEQKNLDGTVSQLPVPDFSLQLYNRGVFSLRPDSRGSGQADIEMTYATSDFVYPDGSKVTLRKPVFTIVNGYDQNSNAVANPTSRLNGKDVQVSPRIGPPIIGLGLLELIPDDQILKLADPQDADGDGISGRANYVPDTDKIARGELITTSLGRFGWKANTPSVKQQVAAALSNDMGIRNPIFPEENIAGTTLFKSYVTTLEKEKGSAVDMASFSGSEIPDEVFESLTFYTKTLGVPPRRDVAVTKVQAGARVFAEVNCVACHTPSFTTSDDGPIAALRKQLIYPFSDGLLHDMGDELADNRGDFLADGREWKTRPLWGIGKTQTVNPRAGFLHDNRARTLEEAILYHGGEAANSRTAFAKRTKTDRENLIAFLRSL